jgi:transposase
MFLGIDISKQNFDAALLDPSRPAANKQGKPRHKAFPNTPAGFGRLQEWLGDAQVHACLEATNTYGDALARFLHEHGHTVSVVNPAQIKAFAGAQLSRTKTDKAKTDKADAHRIAQFCQMHQPPAWTPPAPEAAHLQALVRRLESLQEMHQMEQNRLDTAPAPVRSSLEAVLAVLDQQIVQTRQAIRDHMDQNPTLKGQRDLLVSIPGIADTTAAVILSELLDLSQFTEARQVAAFAGLVPRLRQSGSSVRGRSSLSKVGSPRLRKSLYFPAMAALRFNPAVRALGDRMKASGKCKMVILGAAMRKLLCLAFGVLKSGKPFDASLCLAKLPPSQKQISQEQILQEPNSCKKMALAA